MKAIYEPGPKAGEYAPLTVNHYRGCSHGCLYCYVPRVIKMKRDEFVRDPKPRKDIIKYVEKDAKKYRGDEREINLCFTCDPYQELEMELGLTRCIIEIFIQNGLRLTVLTKGGTRASKDFDLFESYKKARFGTTLIFLDQADADKWEPNAAPISDRIEAIKIAHEKGIPTWVSLEPVIDPDQALTLINQLHPYGCCQLFCVKFISASCLMKGRFSGTFPMGFVLQ